MTDLTQQWENKELKWHKSYYCQNKKGDITVATLMGDDVLYSKELGGTLNFGYWEVLAPCDYEELQELKEENARLKERDEVFSVLIDNLHGLQQEKWYDLVEHGTREQRLDFLRNTEKHTLFGAIDKNMQLRNLLKECKELIKHSFDDYPNSAIYRAINSAIGESEE